MLYSLRNLSSRVKMILFLLLGVCSAVLISYLVFDFGVIAPLAIILLSLFVLLQVVYFSNPKTTLYVLIVYCFTFGLISRESGVEFPFGIFIEVFVGFVWIVALIKVPIKEWSVIKNDLCLLIGVWFIISVVEVANPAGASVMGWLQEIRSAALYPMLIIPVTYVLFKTEKDLNVFLKIVLICGALAALNGVKQQHIGLSAGEQDFLNANPTHLVFGHLRVFSFYVDAGQFGASQAHLCLITLILSFGSNKLWKRLLLIASSLLFFYGMLISGTRGALFALVVGVFLAIVLSKQIKTLIFGSIVALSCLFVLKYTYIGASNYQISRLRTALDPTDPSFNVRLNTQRILTEYMSTRPFGGGLGVLGAWGNKYNQDKFLSSIPPDSYWVKVWAMYGIVGFTIWIGIMAYILGKCCGIVWRLKDPDLRIKGIALTCGYAGILFCSYGNEVINNMPSSIIVYMSWVFVFISHKLDKEKSDELALN